MNPFQTFCHQVERQVSKIFGDSLRKSEAEELACISTPFQFSEDGKEIISEDIDNLWRNLSYKLGKLPPLTRNNWILLSILSWYLPEVTGWELREYLLERNKQLKVKEMECYLQTKNLCLFSLFKQYDFSHSTLFGNILKPRKVDGRPNCKRKQWGPNNLVVRLQQQLRPQVVKGERKRGYTDHGSLPDPTKKGRHEVDNAGLKQMEIEMEREQFHHSVLLEIRKRMEELASGREP